MVTRILTMSFHVKILICAMLLGISGINGFAQEEIQFSQEHVMVLFDPRPYNDQETYEETEIISLVKLVSTRFSKLLFDPSLDGSNNVSKVVSAVAKFNKNHRDNPSSIPIVQLWIQVPLIGEYIINNNYSNYLEYIANSVNNANSIYNGSVEGIIFNSDYLNSSNHRNSANEIQRIFNSNLDFRYKIGVQFTRFNLTKFRSMIDKLTEVGASYVMAFVDPTVNDIKTGEVQATITKYQDRILYLNSSIPLTANTNTFRITPIFRTGYPDTTSQTTEEYSDLVEYWTSMSKWAVSQNIRLAFSDAFDVPARPSLPSRHLGWWKVVQDGSDDDDDYEITLMEKAHFIRQTSQMVQNMEAVPSALVMKPVNITYLMDPSNFDFRTRTKISVELNPKNVMSEISEPKVRLLLQIVAAKFRQISLRNDDMNMEEIGKFLDILARWNSENRNMALSTSLVFSNLTQSMIIEIFGKLGSMAEKINHISENTISSVQMSFVKNYNSSTSNTSALLLAWDRYFTNNDMPKHNFGMELPLTACKKFSEIPILQNYSKIITLKSNTKAIDGIRKNASASARRIVNNFVICATKIQSKFPGIRVVLNAGWPGIYPNNSADYVSLLTFWGEIKHSADINNFSVVMLEAIDNPRKADYLGKYGWWEAKGSHNQLDYDLFEKRNILIKTLSHHGSATTRKPDLETETTTQYHVTTSYSTTGENNKAHTPTTSSSTEQSANTDWGDGNQTDKTFNITGRNRSLLLDSANPDDNEPSSEMFWIKWGVSTACVIGVSMILALLLVWKLKQSKRHLKKEELKEFFEGSKKRDDLGEEQYINCAYNDVHEIPLHSIQFDSVIGSGKFAIFYKALLASSPVAVKVPKKDCTMPYFRSMLVELKILAGVGTHANVLAFLGANTKDLKKGMVYLVTEYCENGTLHSYLRSLRYNLESQEEEAARTLQNLHELYRFAHEIASGMHYLHGKDVIHGDLSAVSVLLDSKHICKISNFGLSRKLDENGDYVKRLDNTWPWRWIALETLKHKIVTGTSDLWSYGVLLWEIFSLGRIPYKNYSLDGFLEKMEKGLRLKRPKYATQDAYDTMLQCWSKNPADRPRFQEQSEYFLLLMKEEADMEAQS